MGAKDALPDRYKPIRLLGEGGAGQVWLCEDSQAGNRPVAVKILIGNSDEATAFRKEFSNLSVLIHPNIPELYGFEQTRDGVCWFTLEYIDGQTFVDAVQGKGVDTFVDLAAESLQALAFIHDFGLVHRDLKPQNLLVRRKAKNGCRLVLLDFGLAESRHEKMVQAGGTLSYMAPEFFEGRSPSIKTDLYSLGVLFLQALIGKHPIDVDPSKDLAGYLERAKTLSGSGDTPESVPGGILQWLNTLRSYDPDNRPSDSREALAQLRDIVGPRVLIETEATIAARLASGAPPGRAKELSALQAALNRQGTRVVLLTGEAGAGKSRLLNAVRADVVRQGWKLETVASVRQDSASSRVEGPGTQEQKSLLILDEFETVSAENGLLIDRIARGSGRATQKLLVAGRPEETSDPRVLSLLADAEFIPTVELFSLAPLDECAVREVLRRAQGTDPSERQIADLLSASGGLAASLESLVVGGAKPGEEGLDRLRDSILTRFAKLAEPAKNVLISLAVLGEPVDVELASTLIDLSQQRSKDALDELSDAGLIARSDGTLRLRSRLAGDVVLKHVGDHRRRRHIKRAIEAIERIGADDRRGKLSLLWRQSGNHLKAAEYASQSAKQALSSGQFELAALWYRRAIVDLPKKDKRYGELRLECAVAFEQVGEFWGAAKCYAAAIRHRGKRDSESELFSRQARALTRAGRYRSAHRVALIARETAMEIRQRVMANSVLGSALLMCGERERAKELLALTAEKLDTLGESKWASETLHSNAMVLEKMRMADLSAAAFDRSIAYAQKHHVVDVLANSLIAYGELENQRGNPELALVFLERAEHIAVEGNLVRQWVWILGSKGTVFELLGKHVEALAEYKAGRTRAQLSGNKFQFAHSQVRIAELFLRLGRPAQAKELLGELDANPHWFPPIIRLYTKLTMAEVILNLPQANQSEVTDLLDQVGEWIGKPKLAEHGLTVVSLECHAHFGTPPPDELWQRFENALENKDLDKQLLARGWLAWSKEKIRCGDHRAALEASENALEALGGRHHDLAAQIFLTMSRSYTLRAAHIEADDALERGREELRKAAEMIEDEDLRNDFLARPVFRDLRKKREKFADVEERLSALYDMVQALNTAGDPEDQLGAILDQALRVVRAERGLILLRSEGDEKYQVRISRNLEEDTVEEVARFSRTAVLAAGRGESVLAIHAANDERLSQMKSVSAYGIKSLLCVPLRVRDELVGAVYVDSRADGALFKEQDLHFLEAFADHAALALENARELQRLEKSRSRLLAVTESRDRLGVIVGRSTAMQRVYDLIERVAESHLPVLIQGDSGTGKELVAREIFARSLRKNGPFLSENCAAIVETLLESELFGHVKGAFTGAERDKVGLFEQADGGTLFLDEVGDMSPAMQARLLRVLQEGELRRVGDETRRHVDVRLLTATHRDLRQLVAAGEFREDLLYRLQVLVIQLPALRDRPTDIALLVRHLLERIAAQRGRKKVAISGNAMELLERYAWPGNVRQLENTLQRLALLADGETISRATIEQDPSLTAALIGQGGKPTLSLKQNERDRIAEALQQTGGNRADAARLLGVSRATIFRKIKRYGLN